VTFMGYLCPDRWLSMSRLTTPAVVDPSTRFEAAIRVVGGDRTNTDTFTITNSNAYSGHNAAPRCLERQERPHVVYAAGNAWYAQIPNPLDSSSAPRANLDLGHEPLAEQQDPGLRHRPGSFNITQLGV